MRLSRMSMVTGCVLAITLFWFLYPAAAFTDEIQIQIDVAPNVLNIQSQGVIVSVHTDIAYSAVVGASVNLNGVSIQYWKADARGNFVAKFVMDEIKTLDGLKIDGYNELALFGYTTDGDTFIGRQEIRVIDIIPRGT
ncbi:MAG: hypothetical protein JSV47_01775 [Deltaproteobacteria bacterium]|nr:MAG: hypothetical protein JSV47_01775 [Deltaproteobacteria bacterium]